MALKRPEEKRMNMKKTLTLATMALLASVASVAAQSFPSKPVTLVVPFRRRRSD